MVGQEVRLHPTAATGTPPNLMVTVDQVQLEPSFLTGTVTAVDTSSNPQTFTLGSLPSFFTKRGDHLDPGGRPCQQRGSKRKKTKRFPAQFIQVWGRCFRSRATLQDHDHADRGCRKVVKRPCLWHGRLELRHLMSGSPGCWLHASALQFSDGRPCGDK